MSRAGRAATIAGLSILGLVALVLIASFVVVQTDWFRNYVRGKIIAVTEESTGGRVEIASFDFDWTNLRATINGFVLHGTEKAGEAPLFQARRLAVELKLFSSLQQKVDLRSLIVDQPQANVIIYPDGSSNVPSPKVKKQSDKSGLETVVDLAVKHFELNNGGFTFAMRKMPLDARGNNLRAVLNYNAVGRSYEGRLKLDPLVAAYGKNAPVEVHADLPVTLGRDRIALNGGKIVTAESELLVSGQVANMASPRTSARVQGHLSVHELARLANFKVEGGPARVNAEIAAVVESNRIDISTARISLGRSNLEASGTLKDAAGQGSLQVKAALDTGELGRLFGSAGAPAGIVRVGTTAKATGNFDMVTLDPLNVDALGGRVAGRAELRGQRYVTFNGELRNFDIGAVTKALGGKPLGYDGIVAGPVEIKADLKQPGASGIEAAARLAISPAGRGVPVSGRVVAGYNGASESVNVDNSYLALPGTRLDVSGSLNRSLRVKLVSRNLDDFKPVAPDLPVTLNRGSVSFDGTVSGTISAPHISGRVAAVNFAVEGRAFDRLNANLDASPSRATVRDASITRGNMQMHVAAEVGLRKWKPENNQPLSANASIRNADLADLMALAGQKDARLTGTLNASAAVGGTVGNPRGEATMAAWNGAIYDQPFDKLDARVNLADRLVTIPNASLSSGAARLELNASFQHPPDSFKTGHIEAHVKSNQIQLAQFQKLLKQTPGIGGTANTNLDIAANLNQVKGEPQVQLLSVNGDFAIRGLRGEGENYGDVAATVRTTGNTVNYRVESNLAASTIRVNGATRLEAEYPTTASATISGLAVERVLALAGKRELPVRGMLDGTANFSGTLQNPAGGADLTLTRAVLYDEPVDRLEARVKVTPQSVDLTSFTAQAGRSRIAMNATYAHAAGDLMTGQLRFQVPDSRIELGQVRAVQNARPGLAGLVRLAADGAAEIRRSKEGPEVQVKALNANAAAEELTVNRTRLGSAKLAASTRGDRVEFTFDSDVARSEVHGNGFALLRAGYPVDARLTFRNVTYDGLRPLMSAASGPAPEFEAAVDGQLSVSGPAKDFKAMRGRLELSRIEAGAARTAQGNPITIRNQGPIVATLDRSIVRIESFRLAGPQTDLSVSGTVPIDGAAPMNVNVNGDSNLGILQQMSRSIYSSGAITLRASVRGTMKEPAVNGRLELKNASLNLIDLPNGISNANGVIVLNGTTAEIQSFTAESGGGKVTAGGFAGFGGGLLTYNLRVGADGVRVRYPPGASVSAGANLTLNGTSERSVLGGTVTIQQIAYSPRSDFGSMLSSTAAPPKAPSAPSGPLAGMRLDIAIRTAPGVSLQAAMAQNLQADADLRLRGNMANPGMTGRVNVSEGDLLFFGTKYTVTRGTIAFYNPYDIKPVLDFDLSTVAKGVEIVLTISGAVDNMKFTYRSDPPLQFQELIALLATGKTPTSDPTLLAKEPNPPAQSFQQMGESALVTQAIANPVASRLQRVFGVSKLKIDPSFTSGSELPQARLTLQQQVTNNVTFTYITNLTQANAQIIRVEWALNERWSAIATREENGRFGLDFFYKRKFR